MPRPASRIDVDGLLGVALVPRDGCLSSRADVLLEGEEFLLTPPVCVLDELILPLPDLTCVVLPVLRLATAAFFAAVCLELGGAGIVLALFLCYKAA